MAAARAYDAAALRYKGPDAPINFPDEHAQPGHKAAAASAANGGNDSDTSGSYHVRLTRRRVCLRVACCVVCVVVASSAWSLAG